MGFFRILSGILWLGNIELTKDRSDQAQMPDTAAAERLCHVLGLPVTEFIKGLLRPTMRAGRDWVTRAQSLVQAKYAGEALARALYERMFGVLVTRINQCISGGVHRGTSSGHSGPSVTSSGEGESFHPGNVPAVPTMALSKKSFIGVLDIAGFEIFESNSLEQLLINYTNERLQQFFNHHMFILEQEEYRQEGIPWSFIDFGLDLAPTIDLIEKTRPMGILACLDEESVMPRGSDRTFQEKLDAAWKGTSPEGANRYEALRFRSGFVLHHYASRVEYDTQGWLDKNKDPVNEDLARLMSTSTDPMVRSLFPDYARGPGRSEETEGTGGAPRGRARGGTFRTSGQRHKEQLSALMTQLHSTEPHFVRCILPNASKRPGKLDVPMVLNQLRCNGVLEGIRITRAGFPSRLTFYDLRQRYEILVRSGDPSELIEEGGDKAAIRDYRNKVGGGGYVDGKVFADLLLRALGIDEGGYRVGKSRVFFRTGVLASMEERRATKLSGLIKAMQGICRGYLGRRSYGRAQIQDQAVRLLQKHVKIYANLRAWPWWRVYCRVRPLLSVTRGEEEMKKKDAKVQELEWMVEELKGSLSREELAKERAEEGLKGRETERAEMEARVEGLIRRVEEAEARAEEAEESLARAIGQAEAAEVRAKKADVRAERTEMTLNRANERIKEVETTIETERTRWNEEKGAGAQGLARAEEALARAEESLRLEKEEVSKARGKSKDLEAKLRETEEGLRDMEAKVEERERRLKAAEERIKEAEGTRQQEESEEMKRRERREQERIQREVEEAERRARRELEGWKRRVEEGEGRVKELEGELEALEGKLAEVEIRAGTAVAAAEASRREGVDRAESRVKEAEEQGERALQAIKEGFKAEMAEIQAKLEETNSALLEERAKRQGADEGKRELETKEREWRERESELQRRIDAAERAKSRATSLSEDRAAELEKEATAARMAERGMRQAEEREEEARGREEEERSLRVKEEGKCRALEAKIRVLEGQILEGSERIGRLEGAKASLEEELKQVLGNQQGSGGPEEMRSVGKGPQVDEATISKLREAESKLKDLSKREKSLVAQINQLEKETQGKMERLEEGRKLLRQEVAVLGERLEEEQEAKAEALRSKQRVEEALTEARALETARTLRGAEGERAQEEGRARILQLETALSELESTQMEAEALAERQERRANRLRGEVEVLEGEMETVKGKLREAEAKLHEAESRAQDMEASVVEERRRREEAELKYEEVHREWEESERTLQNTPAAPPSGEAEEEGVISGLRRAMEVTQRVGKKEVEGLREEMEGLLRVRQGLEAQVENLRQALEKERGEGEMNRSSLERTRAELEGLRSRIALEDDRSEGKEREMDALKVKIASLMSRVEEAEVAREKAERSEARTGQGMRDLEEAMERAKEERRMAEGRVRELEGVSLRWEARMDEVTLELEEVRREEEGLRSLLAREVRRGEERVREATLLLEGRVKEMEGEVSRGLEEIEGWKRRVDEAETRVKDVRRRGEKEINLAKEEVEEIKGRMESLEGDLEESLSRQESLQGRVSQLGKEVVQLRASLDVSEGRRLLIERAMREVEEKWASEEETGEVAEEKRRVQSTWSDQGWEEKVEKARERARVSEQALEKVRDQLITEEGRVMSLRREKIALERRVSEMTVQVLSIQGLAGKKGDEVIGEEGEDEDGMMDTASIMSGRTDTRSRASSSTIASRGVRATERQIRELHLAIADREKGRIRAEEEARYLESRLQRMKSQVEELEESDSQHRLAKRRLERELEESKDKIEGLEREISLFKGRLARGNSISGWSERGGAS